MNISYSASEKKMPVIFVGHGSPMNAIENNEFSHAWTEIGSSIPPLTGIICISAHWETNGVFVTAMETPKTIHDFSGFPTSLYKMQYPAPGSPELAQLIKKIVKDVDVRLDNTWGLDHGTWSVLCRMFPKADIPVIQLSLDRNQNASFHYALGKKLNLLRHKGILIIGSGNIVHNLRVMSWKDEGYDWAIEFDEIIKQLILAGDHEALVNYEKLGKASRLSIPTNEHYLPLLYILALQDDQEQVHFFTDKVTLGSISMRSLWIK
jgi:4,5-DOPA dioxygenase extradiol